MFYADTLLSYPGFTSPFTAHTCDSDKQLGAVISHNYKPISLFSIILSNTQCNNTTTKKERLSIV